MNKKIIGLIAFLIIVSVGAYYIDAIQKKQAVAQARALFNDEVTYYEQLDWCKIKYDAMAYRRPYSGLRAEDFQITSKSSRERLRERLAQCHNDSSSLTITVGIDRVNMQIFFMEPTTSRYGGTFMFYWWSPIASQWTPYDLNPVRDQDDPCIYDAIEIIVNCTYSLGEAKSYNVRSAGEISTYDTGTMIPYYNDEIGAIAGGVSKYLKGEWYTTSKGVTFEHRERYSFGFQSVIDKNGNPSITGGYGLPFLSDDHIRAWAWKSDGSSALLTMKIIRRRVYEEEGNRYEDIIVLGLDSTNLPHGKVIVECDTPK